MKKRRVLYIHTDVCSLYNVIDRYIAYGYPADHPLIFQLVGYPVTFKSVVAVFLYIHLIFLIYKGPVSIGYNSSPLYTLQTKILNIKLQSYNENYT